MLMLAINNSQTGLVNFNTFFSVSRGSKWLKLMLHVVGWQPQKLQREAKIS